MKTVPKEIDESAKIDGASTLRSFVSIIFPLLRPVTITIIVLNVMWIWNDFVLPLLMVNSRSSTRTFGAWGIRLHRSICDAVGLRSMRHGNGCNTVDYRISGTAKIHCGWCRCGFH